jgi:hypothetical protein
MVSIYQQFLINNPRPIEQYMPFFLVDDFYKKLSKLCYDNNCTAEIKHERLLAIDAYDKFKERIDRTHIDYDFLIDHGKLKEPLRTQVQSVWKEKTNYKFRFFNLGISQVDL